MPSANAVVRLSEQAAEKTMEILKNLFNARNDWIDERAGAREMIDRAFPDGHVPSGLENVAWNENVIVLGGSDEDHTMQLNRLLDKEKIAHTMVVSNGRSYVMAARRDLVDITKTCAEHRIDLTLNDIHTVSEHALGQAGISVEDTLEGVMLYRINNPDAYFNHTTVLNAIRQAGLKADIVQTSGNYYLQVNRMGDAVDKKTGEVKTVDLSRKIERTLNAFYWKAKDQREKDAEALDLKEEFLRNHYDEEVGTIEHLSQEQMMLVMPYLQRENITRYWERDTNGQYTLTYDMSNYKAHKAILTAMVAADAPKYKEATRALSNARDEIRGGLNDPSKTVFFTDAMDPFKLYRIDKDGLSVIEKGAVTLIADRNEREFNEHAMSVALECQAPIVQSYSKKMDEYTKERLAEVQETSDLFERESLVNARKTLGILYSDQGMITEASIAFADIQRIASTGGRNADERNLSAIGRQMADDTNGQIYEARDNLDDDRDARRYAREATNSFIRSFRPVVVTDELIQDAVTERESRENRFGDRDEYIDRDKDRDRSDDKEID